VAELGMHLQPFRTLPGIADGPHTLVEFEGDVLDERLVVVDLDVLAELLGEAEFLCKLVHNGVIGQ
jgi:hypothetical protein